MDMLMDVLINALESYSGATGVGYFLLLILKITKRIFQAFQAVAAVRDAVTTAIELRDKWRRWRRGDEALQQPQWV